MKKIVLAMAMTAFIGSYTVNSYAQDGKKPVKTEKKCDKKGCCKKNKKTTKKKG